jgi:hypothetical protein
MDIDMDIVGSGVSVVAASVVSTGSSVIGAT